MSASERLVSTVRQARLHFVTWIVVWAAVARLLSDTIWTVRNLFVLFATGTTPSGRPTTLFEVLAGILDTYSYSMLFLALAAIVEFLFRILEELRRSRRTAEPS
jgi:hypothetical protein